jgi:ribulose-5-phosphate 4-epimerase/fuculose-1-phosphate aldolase
MNHVTRRSFVSGCLAFCAVVARRANAQSAAPAQGSPGMTLVEDLVAANHILVDQGVLDGYGHVSVRHPTDKGRYLMARSVAPELVTAADVLEHDLDGKTPSQPDAKTYLERFIHGEIYRARPDVNAVVHAHSPSLIPFGVTGQPLRPLYHMSAFLGDRVPVFEIRAVDKASDMLVRNPELGKALARTLGNAPVALMRGHGAVIVGPDLPHAVFRSVYTEMNARLQAEAMALGKKITFLDPEEAKRAEKALEPTLGRPWELWKRKAMAAK